MQYVMFTKHLEGLSLDAVIQALQSAAAGSSVRAFRGVTG